MKFLFLVAAMVAIATPGVMAKDKSKSSGVPVMTSVDLAVDWRSLLGQRVKVTGCGLNAADTLSVYCEITTPTGYGGDISIDSESLARDDLRRAMNDCADYTVGPRCKASVEGVVSDMYGDLSITSATIEWATP